VAENDDPRSAAEALFKPKQKAPSSKVPDTQAEPAPAVDPPTLHEPRVLSVLQSPPRSLPGQPAVPEPPAKRRHSRASRVGQIPASEYGRIRALVTYGMTIAQAAEVYDVAVSEIERVVAVKVWE
jgi:hypothetical protein